MSRSWAKASACRLQVNMYCPVLCRIVSLQHLSRSTHHRLAGLPCRLFLYLWSPSCDTLGPSVVFEAVDIPCPRLFHFSHSVDYIWDSCPLPDPDVDVSILFEHTSLRVGLFGRKFVLCIFGQCPGLCTICHSWQHKSCTPISSGRWQGAIEDIPVFGVCRPACHDSSLYLVVLVIFLEAVMLSKYTYP